MNVRFHCAELIEAVAGINYKDKPCRSRINSISDNAYYVQESPEVVVEMLEQMAADDVNEPTEGFLTREKF